MLYALSWYTLSYNLSSRTVFALVMFFQSFSLVTLDCLLDATMVRMCKGESDNERGELQSAVWISRSAGALGASVVGAALLYVLQPSDVFCLTGVLLLPAGALSVPLDIATGTLEPKSFSAVVRATRASFENVYLRNPTIFLAACCAVPSVGIASSYFLRNTLHYTPAQFAIMECISDGAHCAGAVLFRLRLREKCVRKVARACLATVFALRLLQLVIVCELNTSVVFASMEEAALALVGEIMAMPVLVFAAQASTNDCEATTYSTVLGVANLSAVLSTMAGGLIAKMCGVTRTQFTYLWVAVLITALLSLLPLRSVWRLPSGPLAAEPQEFDTKDTHDGPPETSDLHTSHASSAHNKASASLRKLREGVLGRWHKAACNMFRRDAERRAPFALRPDKCVQAKVEHQSMTAAEQKPGEDRSQALQSCQTGIELVETVDAVVAPDAS